MNNKIKWLVALAIVVLVLALIIMVGRGEEVEKIVKWDYYLDCGSDDVDFLRIYLEKWNSDTTYVSTDLIDSVSVSDSTYRVILETDYIWKAKMTAVDTAGNESEFSNTAVCDLIKPKAISGVRFE